MSLILDWNENFSLQANVTNPGYQRTILKGYITENRYDGVYAAPLLPQLFTGSDGNPLTTWRQYIPGTGAQTILSRSGGQPSVPKQDLYWRKIADKPFKPESVSKVEPKAVPTNILIPLLGGLAVVYLLARK